MNTILAKLQSRKLISTLAAYALGAYMIKQGNITEGIALITGAQASYNVGQGIADAKTAEG
jgi:hypothetical protein